ncbi:peptidase family C69 [Microbulbifer flavimaris]|uniref:Peptidase family C69 n=1 Tax=Microbulbifer flavimaris TaxID=1781068 RepID=A0ABX4HY85_9GAMM|nr:MULTISPECIES: C69 family dipeptidase [Microbulbifer]KUJ81622.1 hypothetical protein AVO43_13870 [Microbulbifer sp. ZGT114]PCO04533.1 peptidase family C69 [Microbulbifer flavimaris]
MCDTLVWRGQGETWLAKNSDRDPYEAQRVEVVPAVCGDRSPRLRCTWIEIPQVPDRHACIIGRPAWMWGAEMGVNQCGVAIGNEAIFSRRVLKRGEALLGMDLVRLGLERGASAEEALEVIIALLEAHGQGGPAGFSQRDFRYDNSFLIADQNSAWKLETAGRQWAASRVDRFDSISNALTIGVEADRVHPDLASVPGGQGSFRRRFDTWLRPYFGASKRRRASSWKALSALPQHGVGFRHFAAILRQHRKAGPSGNGDLCMHAAPSESPLAFLRPSQTTNAMIVQLREEGPRVTFTGTAATCCSLFHPVDFSGRWQVCEPDLWEQHRVHMTSSIARGSSATLLEQINAAEAEIFKAVGAGRLRDAESLARKYSAELFKLRMQVETASINKSDEFKPSSTEEIS